MLRTRLLIDARAAAIRQRDYVLDRRPRRMLAFFQMLDSIKDRIVSMHRNTNHPIPVCERLPDYISTQTSAAWSLISPAFAEYNLPESSGPE